MSASRTILGIVILLAVAALALGAGAIEKSGLASIVLLVAIPAATLLVAGVGLLLPRPWQASVIVCVLSGVVALLLAEIYVRSSHHAVPDVGDKILEAMLEERTREPTAMVAYTPAEVLGLRSTVDGLGPAATVPLTGPSRNRLVVCSEGGYLLKLRSDERGFPNPQREAAAERLDVAVIGDSYAFGYCVPQETSTVGRLRETIPLTATFGVGGAGPLVELGILREYVSVLKPAKVVWLYFENDLENLTIEARSTTLRGYLKPEYSQQLRARQGELDTKLRALFDRRLAEHRSAAASPPPSFWQRALSYLRLDGLRGAAGRFDSQADADIGLFGQVLARAKLDVEAWGGEMVFVYLPSWAHFDPSVRQFDVVRQRNRADVLAAARAAGLRVVDLYGAFEATPDKTTIFRGFGLHYTEEGYGIVAREIARALGEKPTTAPRN